MSLFCFKAELKCDSQFGTHKTVLADVEFIGQDCTPARATGFWYDYQPDDRYQATKNFNAGWDACFEYEGQTFVHPFLSALDDADAVTTRYAEMDKAEKNKISHRSLALSKLQAWFKEQKASET
jgi:hypothetical protein